MPTSRPRHMITETPHVERALNELRELLGVEKVDLPELVVLGAHAKLRELRADGDAARAARQTLAAQIRAGDPLVDLERADEVKHLGLDR